MLGNMEEIKITRCKGEGQGECRRCKQIKGWGLNWMCFLYEIEGYKGCYCFNCVKEILKEASEEEPRDDKSM